MVVLTLLYGGAGGYPADTFSMSNTGGGGSTRKQTTILCSCVYNSIRSRWRCC